MGGRDDLALTFNQHVDLGQPFDGLQGWCEDASTGVPLFPLDSGDLTVHGRP